MDINAQLLTILNKKTNGRLKGHDNTRHPQLARLFTYVMMVEMQTKQWQKQQTQISISWTQELPADQKYSDQSLLLGF